jgi:hypothetical protein
MIDQRCARPVIRIIAALLLALQGVAGMSVAWTHANEPPSGVVTIEAGHEAHCRVIHDESRCPICQYARSLITPPNQHTFRYSRVERYASIYVGIAAVSAMDGLLSSRPRAPPALLSWSHGGRTD